MSHKATVWALDQRSIKGTTKIVLWHLCDRYNPEHGCFPSQELLAHDCQVSRSGLNNHLARLEKCGLMRRERRIDPITKRQMSTRYILGFEEGFTPVPSNIARRNPEDIAPSEEKPCPKSGHGQFGEEPLVNNVLGYDTDEKPRPDFAHGAVSGKQADPCPENEQNRVQNLDTNLVREPLSKPVKEEEGAQACAAISDQVFGDLLDALGLDATALPGWWQGWQPRMHVQRWRDKLGLTEAEIVATAEASRQEHPEPPDGPKALDRAMQRAVQRKAEDAGRKRRKPRAAPPPAAMPITDLPAYYADILNSGRYLPVSSITNTTRDAMLVRGLVTSEQLRMRGIR